MVFKKKVTEPMQVINMDGDAPIEPTPIDKPSPQAPPEPEPKQQQDPQEPEISMQDVLAALYRLESATINLALETKQLRDLIIE